MSLDFVSPPCDSDVVPLPAVGDRVRHLTASVPRYGVVHGVNPSASTLLVLRDGAFFAELYPAADWTLVEDDRLPDGVDGSDEVYDARREDALEAEPLPAVPAVTP